MKSRNLLNTQPTDSAAVNTKGLLAVSAPKGGVAGSSVARRFELRYNASPRFARRRQERRQGQALLLAVLIMLLAALLSAVFLAVVSGNLNQSARIADKTRAIEASRTGIAFANAQLSSSSQGDLWRPIDVNPASIPVPTNSNYDFYYSQLDKVQGWASTLVPPTNAADPNYQRDLFRYRNDTYGKFPDPGQSLGDAPKFLVKVEELPIDPTNDFYSPTLNPGHSFDAKHAGEIKITSIGLSDDDPNVFHRSIAYKSGRKKSPWASALRSVSNWNFGVNNTAVGVPYATVTASPYTSTPATFPATNVNVVVDTKDAPQFSASDVPFNIVVVKKAAPSAVIGAVVTAVTPPVFPATTATLTLAKLDSDITPATGETIAIQKAAAIGIGSSIDLLNTGTPVAYASNLPQPNGILTNGSMWLQGQIQLSDLSKTGTKLFTSGSLAIARTPTSQQQPVIQSGDVDAPITGNPNSNQIVQSSQPNFPGDIVLTATAASNGVKTTDLINDGWNKISAQTLGLDYSNSRDVEPFKPAKIDSAENLARYRALTRNSADGIYIDNRDDVEKINVTPVTTPPTLRAMTQTELVNMLVSPAPAPMATAADYARTGVAATAATGVSLEQRHLRGWVGPDEFLARGALVELIQAPNANPQIRVTYDARSDANFNGPDQAKAFRDANGNPVAGVYSRILDWPKDGTLFAEGNIRIRGSVDLRTLAMGANQADFPSLTVVSLNNIYVEGSVSVDNARIPDPNNNSLTIPDPNRKKLMLMAKKNVIVNPTRAVLARTDVQTVATNTAPIPVTGTTGNTPNLPLPVSNAQLFNVGDYVTVKGQAGLIRGLVRGVPSDTQLSIITPDTDIVPLGNVVVRSPLEKRDRGTTVATDQAFFSLVNTENSINRRVVAPLFADATNRNKVTFDHVGDLKQTSTGTDTAGLLIKAEDSAATVPRPSGFTATLTNKQPLDASGDLDPAVRAVNSANRVLRTTNNFSVAPQKHSFTQTSAKTLTQFAAEIALTQADNLPSPAPEGYRYTAVPTAGLGALPSTALAGIGLRYAPGAYFDPAAVSPAKNRPEDFNADNAAPAKFTIPLATSVEYDLNGASALFEPSVNSALPAVKYIGFSPNAVSNDDSLTVDSSFYQLKKDIAKSTIDPRVLALQEPTVATGFTLFPQAIVLKRPAALSTAAISDLLPDYQVRSMKLENINLSSVGPTAKAIKAVGGDMLINAFVYAQEGSWLVIPGDYFRPNPQVRGEKNSAGELTGSYIDYNPDKIANAPTLGQPTEYLLDTDGVTKIADLNRNGIVDPGEKEAALRFVRYNTAPIKFYGAIVENQTAIVADVKDAAGTTTLAKGAVQDWMDKWATYADTGTAGGNVGAPNKFKFMTYEYDPSLLLGSPNANQLRVPVTDELLYEQ